MSGADDDYSNSAYRLRGLSEQRARWAADIEDRLKPNAVEGQVHDAKIEALIRQQAKLADAVLEAVSGIRSLTNDTSQLSKHLIARQESVERQVSAMAAEVAALREDAAKLRQRYCGGGMVWRGAAWVVGGLTMVAAAAGAAWQKGVVFWR